MRHNDRVVGEAVGDVVGGAVNAGQESPQLGESSPGQPQLMDFSVSHPF